MTARQILSNILNLQLLPVMPFIITLFKISCAKLDLIKSLKQTPPQTFCLPNPTISDLSKTISWGRLSIENCRRTSKPILPKVCIRYKIISQTPLKILIKLLKNCKNYKKIHAEESLCNTFSNFYQKMFSSKGCLLLVVYHLSGNVTKNYDFFISSVYAKVITANTFSRDENIVHSKKLFEKMIILINVMKIYIMIFNDCWSAKERSQYKHFIFETIC